MRAWRIDKHGGPEALKRIDLETPSPGPMQVRIRVEAVGLNHLDLWVRNGVPGHKFHLPLIPGCDIAGVIDAFGPGAQEKSAESGLSVGSPVVLSPGVSCGHCEACLGGFDPLCPRYGILGETTDGGCADFVVVPIANVIPRPATLSAIEAASIPIPFLTAWTMLVRNAQVRPGETVLIQAGGSGVSVAAIQIAKLFGADVITTVGSDEKASKARALGADHVINYKTHSVKDEVRKILAGYGKKGCEIVVDHVGADTWADSMRCLAWGGRLVTCGATSGPEVKIDLRVVFFKNISIIGTTMGSKADLIRIIGLVASGKLKAVVDSTFGMEKLVDAHERLESRKAFGKVLVVE